MIDLIDKGGIVMILIIVLSFFAAVIIVERLLFFRKIRGNEEQLINRLSSALEKGHYDEALNICETHPSPLTNLMRVGIAYRQYDETVIKAAITDAANMEVPRMERFLSALGTIAHIAPLLGLLGTVTGNIDAFGVLRDFAASDPSMLAGGISEALLTTAAGIIVAIPAVIFYNYLVSKVNHSIIRLENRVNELVLILKGKGNAVQTKA